MEVMDVVREYLLKEIEKGAPIKLHLCRSCKRATTHVYSGKQEGVDKCYELWSCSSCGSTAAS